jgi:hypothetical protein
MEIELASETLVFNSTLTRLIAREDFIAFIRRESLKSYINILVYALFAFRDNKNSSLVIFYSSSLALYFIYYWNKYIFVK